MLWKATIFGLFLQFGVANTIRYKPSWKSLDTRPLPTWYDDAKFGVFVHWGVYAVPAFHSEWFWYNWHQPGPQMRQYEKFIAKHFGNGTTYADFARQFTAEDFDAATLADIVKKSGARYLVLTSKHHEGFTLWPSTTAWNWNSVEVGAHADLVGSLAASIRAVGLHFGTYFSLMDWYHPLYIADKLDNKSHNYANMVVWPQLQELVRLYQPDLIWSDGDWEVSDEYWRSKEFLAWLYNDSPIKDVVVVNDRWGSGTVGQHGGFLTHSDQFDPGVLMPRKWENCLKLDAQSWGYRRDIRPDNVLPVKTLIATLARTISCGGNLLLNIGLDRFGRVAPIFEERLRQLGRFVNDNEEAIFGTYPWIYQNESNHVWYTSRLRNNNKLEAWRPFNNQDEKNTIIYAFIVDIPRDSLVQLRSVIPTNRTKILLLGTRQYFHIHRSGPCGSLAVDLSEVPWQDWPSREAVVLRIEYAATQWRDAIAELQQHEISFNVAATAQKYSFSPYAGVNIASAAPLSSASISVRCPIIEDESANETMRRWQKTVAVSAKSQSIAVAESDEAHDERNFLVASNFK